MSPTSSLGRPLLTGATILLFLGAAAYSQQTKKLRSRIWISRAPSKRGLPSLNS